MLNTISCKCDCHRYLERQEGSSQPAFAHSVAHRLVKERMFRYDTKLNALREAIANILKAAKNGDCIGVIIIADTALRNTPTQDER